MGRSDGGARRSTTTWRTVVRFEIPLATALRHLGGPAISPDGVRLAYGPGGAEGQKLYVRALDSADTVPLPGTEGARQPFFSPDGGSLGFFARDLLMKVELATGHVTKVCHAARISRGGNWGTDNRIYFARGRYAGIWVVSPTAVNQNRSRTWHPRRSRTAGRSCSPAGGTFCSPGGTARSSTTGRSRRCRSRRANAGP